MKHSVASTDIALAIYVEIAEQLNLVPEIAATSRRVSLPFSDCDMVFAIREYENYSKIIETQINRRVITFSVDPLRLDREINELEFKAGFGVAKIPDFAEIHAGRNVENLMIDWRTRSQAFKCEQWPKATMNYELSNPNSFDVLMGWVDTLAKRWLLETL